MQPKPVRIHTRDPEARSSGVVRDARSGVRVDADGYVVLRDEDVARIAEQVLKQMGQTRPDGRH